MRLVSVVAAMALGGVPHGIAEGGSPPSRPARAPDAAASAAGRSPTMAERLSAARDQTVLARSGFSPGLIDGRPGRKTRLAIEHVQRARGLQVTGVLDESTRAALAADDPVAAAVEERAWVRRYTVTDEDLALITGPIPTNWNERALLERSGYADLEELLAERGWCSVELLRLLNPDVELNALAAGDEVTLPDVRARPLPRLGRVEIVLGEKLVLGFDEAGAPVMLLHCSIAASAEKRPVGRLSVTVIATDPEYTFNPESWPEVNNVSTKLRIAPGPRNPVGLAWIGLDRPGYGMHGSPRPQDIGKTGSHGCFRLANWDAVRLAHAVRVGTMVEVRE